MAGESTFDFSKVPSYEWEVLYYVTYELDISLSSIKEAIAHHADIIKAQRAALHEAIKREAFI